MKFFMVLLMALLCLHCIAQQSSNSAGGNAIGTGGSVSYSVGQLVYTSIGSGGENANQGVQQPIEIFSTGEKKTIGIDLKISAFPNPTMEELHLELVSIDGKNYSYTLCNLDGKLLESKQIRQTKTSIAFSHLSSASYLLTVSEKNQPIQSFTIIKH